MTEIVEARRNIQVEDVQFRSAISEAVGTKLGEGINFINKKHTDQHAFHLNGDVAQLQQQQVGDGFYFAIFDMELTGYAIINGRSGGSGTTEIDLHLVQGDGTDSGSIFSTKPTITTTASDESSQYINLINDTNEAPTGHTLGAFSAVNIDQGEKLRLDIDTAMGGSENLTVILFYRPR